MHTLIKAASASLAVLLASQALGQNTPETPELYSALGAEETHKVLRGETLWGISHRYRPTDSVNINQMMIAVQQRNEDSFIDRNINKLPVGALLSMPNASDVGSVDRSFAYAEVKRQTDEWRGYVAPEQMMAGNDAPLKSDPVTMAADPADSMDSATDNTEQKAVLELRIAEASGKLSEAEAERSQLLSTVDEYQAEIAELTRQLEDRLQQLDAIRE